MEIAKFTGEEYSRADLLAIFYMLGSDNFSGPAKKVAGTHLTGAQKQFLENTWSRLMQAPESGATRYYLHNPKRLTVDKIGEDLQWVHEHLVFPRTDDDRYSWFYAGAGPSNERPPEHQERKCVKLSKLGTYQANEADKTKCYEALGPTYFRTLEDGNCFEFSPLHFVIGKVPSDRCRQPDLK